MAPDLSVSDSSFHRCLVFYACTYMIPRLPRSCWSLLLKLHEPSLLPPVTATQVSEEEEKNDGRWRESHKHEIPRYCFQIKHSHTESLPLNLLRWGGWVEERRVEERRSFVLAADVTTHPSFVSLLTSSPSSSPRAPSFLPPPHPGYPPRPRPLSLSLPFYGLVSSTWNVKWQTI